MLYANFYSGFVIFNCLIYHSYNNDIYNYIYYQEKPCLLTDTKNSLF